MPPAPTVAELPKTEIAGALPPAIEEELPNTLSVEDVELAAQRLIPCYTIAKQFNSSSVTLGKVK